jgi:protein-arginine kinase activator protein McsA
LPDNNQALTCAGLDFSLDLCYEIDLNEKAQQRGRDMDDLAKQLPKMTIKELRDMAKELGAEGVSGMKKEDLLEFIRKAKGITELKPHKVAKKKAKKELNVKELKKDIISLKAKRAEALQKGDKRMATIYRHRISKLKKQTRKVAQAAAGTGG